MSGPEIFAWVALGAFGAFVVLEWVLARRRSRRPLCQAFCPGCGNDLVSCSLTVSTDTDLVRYQCGRCETHSSWDFDAPAPLLIAASRAQHTQPRKRARRKA